MSKIYSLLNRIEMNIKLKVDQSAFLFFAFSSCDKVEKYIVNTNKHKNRLQ